MWWKFKKWIQCVFQFCFFVFFFPLPNLPGDNFPSLLSDFKTSVDKLILSLLLLDSGFFKAVTTSLLESLSLFQSLYQLFKFIITYSHYERDRITVNVPTTSTYEVAFSHFSFITSWTVAGSWEAVPLCKNVVLCCNCLCVRTVSTESDVISSSVR